MRSFLVNSHSVLSKFQGMSLPGCCCGTVGVASVSGSLLLQQATLPTNPKGGLNVQDEIMMQIQITYNSVRSMLNV